MPNLSTELDDLTQSNGNLDAAPPAPLLAPPPERVRFAALLSASLDNDEPVTGAVLNLSVSGLSCSLPCVLAEGEELDLGFRLGLGEPEISVRGSVIWRRRADATQDLYGIRFLELDATTTARIQAVVRERAEGRAGAWPLPVVPTLTMPLERRPHPLLTGAMGMVAGALVAVVATLMPRVGVSRTTAPEEHAVELRFESTAAELEQAMRPAPEEAALVPVDLVPAVEAAPVPEALPEPLPEVAPTPEPTPAPEASPSSFSNALAPEVKLPAEPDANHSVLDTSHGDSLVMRLAVDGPVEDYQSFWLDSPRRLVIDIEGRKSTLGAKEMTIPHRLATRLRVGIQGSRTRFVIEADAAAAEEVGLKREGSVLVVELKPQ